MKLTKKEQLVCRLDAMDEEPPPYEVLVIPGDSPPEWESCSPYCVDIGTDIPIQTEIRVLVGEEYVEMIRAVASARDKIR